ncbi:MAG: hypothetical protein R3231_08490 [bacterium]|nr:hypothetical protein [bacterium]
MKRTVILVGTFLLFAVTNTACKPQASETAVPEKAGLQMPADVHQTMPPGGQQMPGAAQIHGPVVETLDASRYTYIQVDTGTEKIWAAAPQFEVNVGDHVTFTQGMAMANFHSEALNRDFDRVYFVSAVQVEGAGHHDEAPAQVHGTAPAAAAPPSQTETAVTEKPGKAPIDLSGITKAEGGSTIAELYADPAALSGKKVLVRGKVVKFSPQILGTNWIHIQDGTGDAGKNDLTVTSSDTAKVGDTIVVSGVLATDKDFGGGYRYDVIVENAKVAAE